jgi:cyclic pyranopterin phosphate synthase
MTDHRDADSADESDRSDGETEPGAERGLSHVSAGGEVSMVDIGAKEISERRAIAVGELALTEPAIEAVRADRLAKGDVLATARIAATQAVKRTWETIPMCHQIPITSIDTDVEIEQRSIVLSVTVGTTGKTGCEMEALQGVTTGLNTIWDMVKAVEKDSDGQYPATEISGVRVVRKEKLAVD